MTHIERVARTLALEPVDHVAAALDLWDSTVRRYVEEGHLLEGEDIAAHFDEDFRCGGSLDCTADLDFEEVIVEETDETILRLDGNGATLRRHKLHESTPEHVDFAVKDRAEWFRRYRELLVGVDRRRIPFEEYEKQRALAADQKRFFCWSGIGPFEQMHPLCGHEYMLMGMALDPEWISDMVQTYVDLTIHHLEILFTEKGRPDGFWVYEDMGFKGKPFMSPAMYGRIIQPGHKRLFDFAHSLGCKVIVHSCGFVEPLMLGLVEAGMDCLQAMEVKAGMDMPRLAKRFGDRIAFFGNIDVRSLISNDFAKIEAELQKKIRPVLDMGGGYILHTDHSEPPDIDYETIQFFLKRGREIGTLTLRHA